VTQRMYSRFFRKSKAVGILLEVAGYGCILLCGYLLSGLLKCTMAGQYHKMKFLAFEAAVAVVLSGVLKFLLTQWRSRVRFTDTQSFRDFLYGGVIDRRVGVKDPGEMNVKLTGDVGTIAEFYQQTMPVAVSGIVVMICAAVLVCLQNVWIGLIFFTLNLIQLLPVFLYEHWSRQIYEQTHSDEESYCGWMLEGYNGIRTLKAYGAEKWYMERYMRLNHAIISSGKRAEKVGTVENIVFNAVDSLLNYGSYVVVGVFVLLGEIELSQTPLLILLAGYLFSSISSVFDLRLQQIDAEEAAVRLRYAAEQTEGQGAEVLLRAENVTKRYGEHRALDGVSLDIHKGDRILLQGVNGGGKTTLLRILLGLETVDGGKVSGSLSPQDFAVCLQEEPELTMPGSELLEAMLQGGAIDREAVFRHLRGFGAADILSKPLHEMSPGARKKFYLSAALAHTGELLLLDEPTNHLDKQGISYLTGVLQSRGGTLVVCTHSPEIALHWTRKICVEGGRCYEH